MTNIARGGEPHHYPDDQIEQWVRWWRDRPGQTAAQRDVIDQVLDDLRDHIATGEPLHRECGPNVEADEEDRWTP